MTAVHKLESVSALAIYAESSVSRQEDLNAKLSREPA